MRSIHVHSMYDDQPTVWGVSKWFKMSFITPRTPLMSYHYPFLSPLLLTNMIPKTIMTLATHIKVHCYCLLIRNFHCLLSPCFLQDLTWNILTRSHSISHLIGSFQSRTKEKWGTKKNVWLGRNKFTSHFPCTRDRYLQVPRWKRSGWWRLTTSTTSD
jgi:hypothetical protein